MTRYIGLIDGEEGGYGVSFPDLPGCVAMGTTVDDVLVNAAAVLEEWVADELADGRGVPEPRSAQELRQVEDVAELLADGSMMVLVPLVLNAGKAARANISIDAGLLRAIDEAASRHGLTRSAFLASAAREKIETGR